MIDVTPRASRRCVKEDWGSYAVFAGLLGSSTSSSPRFFIGHLDSQRAFGCSNPVGQFRPDYFHSFICRLSSKGRRSDTGSGELPWQSERNFGDAFSFSYFCVSQMQFQRFTAVILVLTSLFSGAWMPVHVGWHSKIGGSQRGGETAGTEAGCGCCSHHCGEKAKEQASQQESEKPASEERSDHDPNSCRICQAFYLSRVADLPASGSLEDLEETLLHRVVAEYECCTWTSISSFSSRGPPLA